MDGLSLACMVGAAGCDSPLSAAQLGTYLCLACRLNAEDIASEYHQKLVELTDGSIPFLTNFLKNDALAVLTLALLPMSGIQLSGR